MTATRPVWVLPARGPVAMFALVAAEAAIFTIFVVAYLFYVGKSATGPQPKDVLDTPIFCTICLLSSSLTIFTSPPKLSCEAKSKDFAAWWGATILLGAAFLFGTATEWRRLIYHDGLTISTNLFGTTYYSLVGLHGFHVIVGLLLLSLVMAFTLLGHVGEEQAYRVDVLSIYWHLSSTRSGWSYSRSSMWSVVRRDAGVWSHPWNHSVSSKCRRRRRGQSS